MQDLFFDTGHENKRRLIKVPDIKHELGCEIAKALPGLHAFTGCDSTSAFMRKGKKGPLKVLMRHTQYVKVFQQLGEEASNLCDTDLSSLERFVCAMYGKPTYSDIDKVRCAMYQSRYEPKSTQKTFQSRVVSTSAYFHLVNLHCACIVFGPITSLTYGSTPTCRWKQCC